MVRLSSTGTEVQRSIIRKKIQLISRANISPICENMTPVYLCVVCMLKLSGGSTSVTLTLHLGFGYHEKKGILS